MNDRDTHFANAAKLLVEKTMATRAMDTLDAERFLSDDEMSELQTLFAQFTYDLVVHTMDCAYAELPEYILPDASHVPDLAAWPEPPTTAE